MFDAGFCLLKEDAMKKIFLPALSLSLLYLTNCSGGSSNSANSPPTTVLAQQAYSNSSLSGTYATTMFYDQSAGTIGTIQFDGNGNISGGTVTSNPPVNGTSTCQYSLKGSYSLQSTGVGMASLTITPSASSCRSASTIPYTIAAGQQGQSLMMLTSNQDQPPVFVWAVKQ